MFSGIVRRPIPGDAERLGGNLRGADLEEIRAAQPGKDPRAVLRAGFESTPNLRVVEIEGEPAAAFGVVPDPTPGYPKVGLVWMVGSPALYLYWREFARRSRPLLAEASLGYDLIWNVVHERNVRHVEWLRRLGFTFFRKVPINGHQFIEFAKRV